MDREHIHGYFDFAVRIGGLKVANVTGNFSVTVVPATPPPPPPPPLVLTPATGTLPSEQEGVDVGNVLMTTVSGGVSPYTYQFSGLPAGVTAIEVANPDGSFGIQLAGSPAAGDAGNYSITVIVTDSGPASAVAQASVKVAK